jgi:hypothetical protein
VVTVPVVRLRAAVPLRAGEPVRPEQLQVERSEAFPSGRREAESPDQVAGLHPRRTIPAGAVVRLEQYEAPHDIGRAREGLGVEAAGGGKAPLHVLIDQQDAAKHAVLAHEVFIGQDLLAAFFRGSSAPGDERSVQKGAPGLSHQGSDDAA